MKREKKTGIEDFDKLTPFEAWFSAFCLAASLVTLIICACVKFFN